MHGALMILAGVVMICLVSSTKESRAEMREKIRPWARWLWIPAALIWLGLLWPP